MPTAAYPYSAPEPSNPHKPLQGFNSATGTSNTEVIASQGAGYKIAITRLHVFNSQAAGGTSTGVLLKSATTTIWGAVAAPASGGVVLTFDPPLICNANEAFNFAAQAAVSTIYVSAVGYRING